MTQKQIAVNDQVFDCRVAGRPKDPAVILLHGFPETSFMWIPLMETLSSQGYYCIAPNMRGYSAGASPKGRKHYQMHALMSDIADLATAIDVEQFHLIGHDWGSGVGWNVVSSYPQRVRSWTALSVPHPRAFRKAYSTDPKQKEKSRYMVWFQLPWLPEWWIRRKEYALLKRLWKNSSPDEVADYLTVFRRKGALTASLNYYRANLRGSSVKPSSEIATPTLFIWGNTDLAVTRTAAENNHKYMKGPYTYREVDGGHWLMQTNGAEVAEAVLKHLADHRN